MKAGDYIRTPRFLSVRIEKVFDNEAQAREEGYKEPTHYTDNDYGVLGKSIDLYHMEFAAYRKHPAKEDGIRKLDIFIKRLLLLRQNEIPSPDDRIYFTTIRECYGQDWQDAVDAVRKALTTGEEQVLRELEGRYAGNAKELRGAWHDEDTDQVRSGYPFEAGFYETLADICHNA